MPYPALSPHLNLKTFVPALLPAVLLTFPQLLLWVLVLEQPITPQTLLSAESATQVSLLFLFTWLGLLAGHHCPAGLPTRSQRTGAIILTAGAGAICCASLALCLLRALHNNLALVPEPLILHTLPAVSTAWVLAVFISACCRKTDKDAEAPIVWRNPAAPRQGIVPSGQVLVATTALETALVLLLVWGAGFPVQHPLAALPAALGALAAMLFAPAFMPERLPRDAPTAGPWVQALCLLTGIPFFLGGTLIMMMQESEWLGKHFAIPLDTTAALFLVAWFAALLLRVLCRETFLRSAQDRLQDRMEKQACREARRACEEQPSGFLCHFAEDLRPLISACLFGLALAAGLSLLFFFRVLALEPETLLFCAWFGVMGCLLTYVGVLQRQEEARRFRKQALLIGLLVAVARENGSLQELERKHILRWFDPEEERQRRRDESLLCEYEQERMRENPEAVHHEDERKRLRLRELLKQAETAPRSLESLLSAWDTQPKDERQCIALPEVFRLVYLRQPPAPDGLALARTIARRFGVSDLERLLMEASYTDIDQKTFETALERFEDTDGRIHKETSIKKE